MRIAWKEDDARAVAASLRQMQQELEQSLSRASQVKDAMREADPDGSNKRMKAISANFEAALSGLKRLAESASDMEKATNDMINTFENTESEAIRLLVSLDAGHGTPEGAQGATAGQAAEAHIMSQIIPPIAFPKLRIAPVMRFSALGPTSNWLLRLLNRK